jgi:hypothetical protein
MIPTAEETYYKITGCIINHGDVKTAMIEFAKLHVEAALKEASEKVKIEGGGTFKTNEGYLQSVPTIVNKDSILNAYSLKNIK